MLLFYKAGIEAKFISTFLTLTSSESFDTLIESTKHDCIDI